MPCWVISPGGGAGVRTLPWRQRVPRWLHHTHAVPRGAVRPRLFRGMHHLQPWVRVSPGSRESSGLHSGPVRGQRVGIVRELLRWILLPPRQLHVTHGPGVSHWQVQLFWRSVVLGVLRWVLRRLAWPVAKNMHWAM
jgi:hypothetical protein